MERSRRETTRDADRSSRDRGGREESRDTGRDRGSRDRDDSRSSERSSRGSERGDRSERGGRSEHGGRSGGVYEYRQRDSSLAKKRSEQGGKDFDKMFSEDVTVFSVNDGPNEIRFLPPTWDEPEHYGLDIYVHYRVGPDQQTYLCLHKMKGEACPICEERAQALKDGDEDYAKELEPKKRVLTYIIDRDDEKKGIQAWAMPWTLDRDIIKVTTDKRTNEVLSIDDPENGFDVQFEKEGTKDRTKYLAPSIARRESSLGNDKALDFVVEHPLPSILVYFDYDHIADQFGGGGGKQRSSRDRDSERDTGRDRDSGRGHDREDRGSRDRDDKRDSDRGRGSSDREHGRSSSSEPEFTWSTIHEMSYDELCAVIDSQRLDIDPEKSKDDADLADWICDELKLKEEAEPAPEESSGRSRLSSLRRGRE